jgi:aminomethyltransferase (EC 2.1.2.10)
VPGSGAAVFDGDENVGSVTRACESPTLGEPVALALLSREVDERVGETGALTVRVDGDERPATAVELPLVEGSDRSERLPGGESPTDD